MSFSHTVGIVFFMLTGLGTNHGYASTRMVEAPRFIYEIFTQSFADSNGDGIGDLEGIRSKLDYISSLGADAIWLTPIFESPSYHGYDVTDYFRIKSVYGNLSNFHDLIFSAHAKGIKVLLDLPVNHTSNHCAWFSDKNDYLWSKTKSFLPAQWFPFQGDYYFSSFSPSMPDLNWKNPDVLTKIEGVFDYWTAQGVDGFRLDAAKFLIKGPNGEQNQPETHQIWQKIAEHLGSTSFLIGEIWDNAAHIAGFYGHGYELDAAFDFPVEASIRSSLEAHDSKDFVASLTEKLRTYTQPNFATPFLGNHDLDRLASILRQDVLSEKLAALILFTLPGTPTLYYGDETGTLNGSQFLYPGDLAKRTPMNWKQVETQQKDRTSLLASYQALSSLRKRSQALTRGTLSDVQNIGALAASFVREDRATGQKMLIVLNFGLTEMPITQVNVLALRPSALYGHANILVSGNSTVTVSKLGPKQGVIFSL